MAAQCDTLSGYLQQSDQGSNSERSTDSPLPGSEEDLSGLHPLPDPEWTEERFRVDRKKLEVMLLGKLNQESLKYFHWTCPRFIACNCSLSLFPRSCTLKQPFVYVGLIKLHFLYTTATFGNFKFKDNFSAWPQTSFVIRNESIKNQLRIISIAPSISYVRNKRKWYVDHGKKFLR